MRFIFFSSSFFIGERNIFEYSLGYTALMLGNVLFLLVATAGLIVILFRIQKGKESVILARDTFLLKKVILKKSIQTRNFDVLKIENLRIHEQPLANSIQLMALFNKNLGTLKFDYQYDTIYFGFTYSEREAKEVLKLLNKHMAK